MFRLDTSPTFEAPVRWEAMAPTGCQRVKFQFTGIFARLTEDEKSQLQADIKAGGLDDRQVARRLLRGWGADVCDASGNAVPFTEHNLAAALNMAGVSTAVVLAWHEAQPRAAAGN